MSERNSKICNTLRRRQASECETRLLLRFFCFSLFISLSPSLYRSGVVNSMRVDRRLTNSLYAHSALNIVCSDRVVHCLFAYSVLYTCASVIAKKLHNIFFPIISGSLNSHNSYRALQLLRSRLDVHW